MIRILLLLCGLALLAGCNRAPTKLALSFGSYAASPVVLTGFSIGEGAPTDTTARAVDTDADILAAQGYGRTGSTALVGLGKVGRTFVVNAAWEEIMTGRAYAGSIEVALEDMNVDELKTMDLDVVMGPHGLLLIASDDFLSEPPVQREAGQVCVERTPDLDRIWWRRTGYLPEIERIVARERPEVAMTDCAEPSD